jgi:nitrogen fixation NifU-like protein
VNASLYDEAIKALARAAHGAGSLSAPDALVRLDNPYCGDRIDLALTLNGSRIGAVAHDTRGCLLCCASASLIGLRAPGADMRQVEHAIAASDALLAGRELPALTWNELGSLLRCAITRRATVAWRCRCRRCARPSKWRGPANPD